ncbi:MAG: TMEM165/GDT1 family protein [Nitrososphaeria archaeon]
MLQSLLSTLALVLLAEIGDKTQLCTLALSIRYRRTYSLVLGAGLGFLVVDSLAVAVGVMLLDVVPLYALKILAGVVFVLFGVYFFLKREEDYCLTNNSRSPFISSFILICTTEMGDKTQVLVVVLSASYAEPLAVISGAMIALVSLTALTVLIGNKLVQRIPMQKIRKIVPIIFIALGVLRIIFHD